MAKKISNKRKSSSKKTKRTSKKPKVSDTVKQYVKRAIGGNTETKNRVYTSAVTNFGCVPGATPWAADLIPDIAQGVDNGQRVGDSIRVVGATIKGSIRTNVYNSTTNPHHSPMMVKLWLVSSKVSNSNNIAVTDPGSAFFDDNGPTGFTGKLGDMVLPVNHSRFVLHKTWTKRMRVWDTSYAGETTMPRVAHFSMNIGKYMRNLKFESANHDADISKNLWLIASCIYDGIESAPVSGCAINYIATYKYKDA